MKPLEPSLTLEELIQGAATLSHDELYELYAVISGLLEATGSKPETEQVGKEHGSKGSIEWKMIPDTKRGKVYGPYPYLRYWKGGSLKSKYLKNYKPE